MRTQSRAPIHHDGSASGGYMVGRASVSMKVTNPVDRALKRDDMVRLVEPAGWLVGMFRFAASRARGRAIWPAALLLLAHLMYPAMAQGREIWLGGIAPVVEHDGKANGPPSDYMELFRRQAPWSRAARDVDVLKVSARFLFQTPDGDLSLVFEDLKRRHIALAVEMGFLIGENCGKGVEGYSTPLTTTALARRVHSLNGELAYVAMDEELRFGHQYGGPRSCKFPITEIARQVAVGIKQLRQFFPNLKVGDIEPIGSIHPKEAADEIMQWAGAYRSAVGEPLAFLDADVQWGLPWKQELRLLANDLHSAHIGFGIIYNGDGSNTTGKDWTRQAEERFVAIEDEPALVPDRAILQSWMPQPDHMLPETEPGTMTYLVDRYAASPSRISAERVGPNIVGRVTDGAGNPIERASVQVLAVASARAKVMNVRWLTGVIPPGAASATIGLRINAECGCSGPADVAVGTMVYRDDRSGQTVQRQFGQPVGTMATGSSFVATAGQEMAQNTPGFPVTPGDPFRLEVPLSVSDQSAEHGLIAMIFLDSNRQGIGRRSLPFQPSTAPVGTTVTDASGQFVLPLSPALRNAGPGYLALFNGNDQYRLSSGLLP